jgi:hypothetical protein
MRTPLALVALLLAGCASTPFARPTSPAAASASADPTNRVDAILASVSLPPGSVRVAKAPTEAIGSGSTLGGVPDADRKVRTEFWTTPQNVADTLAFLTVHPPKDMGAGNCCSTIDYLGNSAQVVEFSGPLRPGEASVDLQVGVGAIPGGGTGIRVGAEIDLVVPRGKDQTLAGVQTVVLRGTSYPSAESIGPVTLDGAAAARLAADVNALPTVLGISGCLGQGADITMTFGTSNGRQQVEFAGYCPVVRIGGTGDDPGLVPSADLDADLAAALGVPVNSLSP